MVEDIMTLEMLRNELPITSRVLYFQTGMNGPTPDSVLRTVNEELAIESHSALAYSVPGAGTSRAQLEREDTARADLASLLSVDVAHLGMTTNTAQAMHRVFRAIDWEAGDEICVSSLEHLSTFDAGQMLEQRHGVRVQTVEAEHGDGDFLERLSLAISDRTKLAVLSQVSSPDGRRLPVREAADLAHQRGVPVVVDGAQAVGVYPVDVPALGCDYYVGSGHKWLLGPRGTGFLWVAPEQLSDFRPDLVPDVSLWQDPNTPAPPVTVRKRVEFNTYNHALVIGLGQAVGIAQEIGLATIEARVARLSKQLRDEVSRWGGIRVVTPMAAEASAGITTLAFDGVDDNGIREIVTRLAEEDRVIVKFQWLSAPARPGYSGMRISLAAFNTEDEIATLVDRLKDRLEATRRRS